jgi:hypothetical protein
MKIAIFCVCAGLVVLVVLGMMAGEPSNATGPARATTPVAAAAPPVAPAESSSANRAHLALLNGTEEKRALALGIAIISAGETCDRVTRTFHQGTLASDGTEFWNVGCRDGNTYSVSVKNDAGGSTKVMSCALLKAVANSTLSDRRFRTRNRD